MLCWISCSMIISVEEVVTVHINDPCAVQVLKFMQKALQKQKNVSFNEVMAAPGCKKYSVSDIGKALELLRRNGFVKASSRFGCSELLEFNATEVTEKGELFLKNHL